MLIQKILLTTGFLGIIAGTTLCVVFVAVGDIYYLIRGFAHLLFGLILMPILKVPGTVKIVAFGSSIILLFLDFLNSKINLSKQDFILRNKFILLF